MTSTPPRSAWDFDVIVVGGGAAGIPCATAAEAAGARVLLVEKTDRVGGSLWVSGGHVSAAGTRRQRERGIEDSVEAHYADALELGHGKANSQLLRLAVEAAPGAVDWLADLGFAFAPDVPVIWYSHEPYRVPRTYWGTDRGRSLLAAMLRPFDDAVARGGIVVELEQRLTDLITADGVVVGVAVRGRDGAVGTRRAPVTVLATGGYAANLTLLAEAVPGADPLVTGAPEHAQGDGLVAAGRIGAAVHGREYQLANTGGIETAPGSRRVDVRALAAALTPQYRPPRELHVNRHGTRFLAEDEPSVDARERAVADQPGQQVWAVFDDAAIDGEPLVPPWSRDELQAEAAGAWRVWSAETLEALARLAGIEPAGLVATVAAWNGAVASGADPLGRRDPGPAVAVPPFYAVRLHAAHLVTFGGLAVDAALNVLDGAGRPIAGLYAVGEVLGAATFMGDAYVGGMCVTPAVSLGRRLGEAVGAQAAARSGSRNNRKGR